MKHSTQRKTGCRKIYLILGQQLKNIIKYEMLNVQNICIKITYTGSVAI